MNPTRSLPQVYNIAQKTAEESLWECEADILLVPNAVARRHWPKVIAELPSPSIWIFCQWPRKLNKRSLPCSPRRNLWQLESTGEGLM